MIYNQDYSKFSYPEITKQYFTKRHDRFQLISFSPGFGGGILYRVLAHNTKYYWEKDFSEIITPQKRMGPLDWPDYDIGYNSQPNSRDKDGKFVPKDPLQQRLTVVHIGCHQLPSLVEKDATKHITGPIPDDDMKEIGLKHILMKFEGYFRRAKDKTLLIRTHDLHSHSKFPKTTTIRIWGKNSTMPDTQYNSRKEIDPVDASNVINVNIDNFLSTDYKTFEDEYFMLCEKLNINPTPIPVRGYILNYLDRRNNYSNKVIPRIK